MMNKSSSPAITTIIPTYRRPKLLRRAIKSVLAQTYPDFQVCVYDNASGDETASIVSELAKADARVKYYCHSRNIGGFRNWAYGMGRVESAFFSFLSDDDVLLPEFYATALRGLEKYPEAICSSLATITMDDAGRVLGVPLLNWRPGFYAPPEGLLTILKYQHPDWTGTLFRREVVERVGGLDEEIGASGDLDYLLRITVRFPIVVSREPGAIFVTHPLSLSGASRFDTIWPGCFNMIRNLAGDERIPCDVRTQAERALTENLKNRLFMHQGLRYLVERNWEDALKAAEVLGNHYHLRSRAFLLRASTQACRHLPPVYFILHGLYRLRELLGRLKNRQLQKDYGVYARLLEL